MASSSDAGNSGSVWKAWASLLAGDAANDALIGSGPTNRGDSGAGSDDCSISVVQSYRCTTEASEESGLPIEKCERTKKVLRHCLGRPAEVVESTVEKVDHPSFSPFDLGGRNIYGGRVGRFDQKRGGEPLNSKWFLMFGHDDDDVNNHQKRFDNFGSSPARIGPLENHRWFRPFDSPGGSDAEPIEGNLELPGGERGESWVSAMVDEAFRKIDDVFGVFGRKAVNGEKAMEGRLESSGVKKMDGSTSRRSGEECTDSSEDDQAPRQQGRKEDGSKNGGSRFRNFSRNFYDV